MNDRIQIHFTTGSWVGLTLLAVFAVGLFGASMMAFHPAPNYQPHQGFSGQSLGDYATTGRLLQQPIESSPPVNTSARDEIKHAGPCLPCQQQRVNQVSWNQVSNPISLPPVAYQPSATIPVSANSETWSDRQQAEAYARHYGARLVIQQDPTIGQVTCHASMPDGSKTQTYAGVNCFKATIGDMQRLFSPSQPQADPQPVQPNVTPAPSPVNGRKQITLFAGNDARSRDLISWFNSDSRLAKLRTNCAFEVITPQSPMYAARFANVISQQDFPAIIFAHGDGGHIYAAGGPMLPRSANTLYSDLHKAYDLALSVKNAPLMESPRTSSGLIKAQGGYSWDRNISPNLQLVGQSDGDYLDCPDGNCDTSKRPGWVPGQRVRDGLFPSQNQNPFQAIVWANSNEILTGLLGLVVVGLFFAIFNKIQGN
jgi:hypothetical protein